MVNNEFDFDVDLYGNNFKSCFARSMAVNSQYKQKTTGVRQLQSKDSFGKNKGSSEKIESNNGSTLNESPNVTRFVKHNHKMVEDSRRFSCPSATNSRRESLCTTRPLPNIPIENIMVQSQIHTLQWQLKQTEASRDMYRAVMIQLIAYLEKSHKSLEISAARNNCPHVPRPRSEHYVSTTLGTDTIKSIGSFSQYADSAWKPPKKIELLPEEIPPEKLAQEAFRLLRTAQSVLNTKEPDLAQVNKINEPEDDINFISQLAKEFPQENKPRPATISLSPKLLIPEKEPALVPKITRKLSLYSNEDSIHSINEEESDDRNNFVSLNSKTALNSSKQRFSLESEHRRQSNSKCSSEKSVSPPVSSIGSTEDESGFSSMNSFQEVGLPVSSSSLNEDTLTKEALLRSMLHDNYSEDFYSLQDYKFSDSCSLNNSKCESPIDTQRLWSKSRNVIHKRSSSTPVQTMSKEKINMKVLWV